jgi:hypothetical protein
MAQDQDQAVVGEAEVEVAEAVAVQYNRHCGLPPLPR